MNIFVCDNNPVMAAKYLCDKHVVKMILETSQLLSNAHPIEVSPYRHTHVNHPCSIWVRESVANYNWLLMHGWALCEEYTERYGKIHACQSTIQWLTDNVPVLPNNGLTPHPQCMPNQYKQTDVVSAYRNYMITEKAHFSEWKLGNIPWWWNSAQNLEVMNGY